MKRTFRASTLLTAAALVHIAGALGFSEIAAGQDAKNRCEADLSRVDTSFCLADVHKSGNLQYSWQLNDAVFDLSSRACLTDGSGSGARRDLVLAIDRSQNAWYADTARGKFSSDNLSTAAYIINKLRDEAKANPQAAPKVSVLLFSSTPDCREWTGGPIAVNREFPCLFVRAGSVADQAHVDNLLGILKAADKKYSQGGLSSTSDYAIVADALASDAVGLANSPAQAGLMLFSDGRTYKGADGDAFAYLRSGNYAEAQTQAVNKFGQAALKKYFTVFALSPVADPAFDATHADAYDNMCALAGASAADCSAAGINYADPKTWPVNKLDLQAFANRLATSTSVSTKPVILVTAKQDIDPALEALRTGGVMPIEAVSYSINGGVPKAGTVQGDRLLIETLPADQSMAVELLLKSGGAEFKIPMAVTTHKVPFEGVDQVDKEMLCRAEGGQPGDKLSLKDLQGGSASCGVVAGVDAGRTPWTLMLAFLPLLVTAVLASRRRAAAAASVAAALAAAAVLVPAPARAQDGDQKGGLNALQYRPVVDGIGTTERATTLGAGNYNMGLFMDYANDTVELGGEKNKRLDSVMDDLVTAHAVGNFGLHERLSLGVHMPFVHKSDVDRTVSGEEVEGGQLGQPSDMSIALKFSAMTRPAYALGLMPIVTLATGNPDLLLGDGTNSYGALFLVSGGEGQMSWAFNTGYVHREKALELEDDRANTLKVRGQIVNYGGAEYRYSPLLSFGGSVQLKISAGESSNPAEWTAMSKARPLTGLETQVGFGTGLGKGYGSPDYRIFAGVTYVPGAAAAKARAVAQPAPVKAAPAPAAAKAVLKSAPAKPAAIPAKARR